MNVDSPYLNILFSSSESLVADIQSLEVEGTVSQNFADALKAQIKQLSDMKELAGQLNKKGIASEFLSSFGSRLPIMHSPVAAVHIEHTIEALENVLNSLEYVATGELNLEARLQHLIEKTDELKAEALVAVEIEDSVAQLAAEIQTIVFSQEDQQGSLFSLTDELTQLETQIANISKQLATVKEAPALITPASLQTVASVQNADNAGLSAITHKPVIKPELAVMLPEISKQVLTQRPIIASGAWGQAVDTGTAPLLQPEHAFGKPGSGQPLIGYKQNEIMEQIDEIEGALRSEKIMSRVAADVGPLNRVVLPENKELLLSMGKHFSHPEWQKEMGERVLWLHKQAIPMAEIRLNPRHLGPITIRIDMQQEQSTVLFIAQHAVVKEAIEATIPKLREMFSVQQLNLTEVSVSQEDAGQRQKGFSQMYNGQGHDKNKQPGFMAEHDEQPDLMDIIEEIEVGRMLASYGVLSLFA